MVQHPGAEIQMCQLIIVIYTFLKLNIYCKRRGRQRTSCTDPFDVLILTEYFKYMEVLIRWSLITCRGQLTSPVWNSCRLLIHRTSLCSNTKNVKCLICCIDEKHAGDWLTGVLAHFRFLFFYWSDLILILFLVSSCFCCEAPEIFLWRWRLSFHVWANCFFNVSSTLVYDLQNLSLCWLLINK